MLWIVLILVVLATAFLVILDSDVARALASRRRDNGLAQEEEGEGMRQRLDHLEGEVERLTDEVRRLEEESRFLHELLADRSRTSERLPRRDEGG